MADYYTMFSFTLPLDTPEKVAWAKKAITILAEHEADGDGKPDAGFAPFCPDDYEGYLGYEVELQRDELWIYAEDSGAPEHVVPLVQDYLATFDPQGAIGFEWANSCSKPRADAFGGGAVVIRADEAVWNSSEEWLYNKLAEINSGTGDSSS